MSELKMRTNKDLMLLNQTFETSAEAIETLARLAQKQGFVEEEFVEKVLAREKEYPTGLEMPIPLAIPHIADGCKECFVAVATLQSSVIFKSMDLSGDDIPVQIVFLFGILDPKSQLAVLRKFAATFSNKAAVERLLAADGEEALLSELDAVLEGLLQIG